MSANTAPIYTKTPNIGFTGPMTAANATLDITSGTAYLGFTAGINGSFVDKVLLKASPANATAATVMRVWLNNGGALGTASNSSLIGELGIPATVAQTAAAQAEYVYAIGTYIPAGYKIYITLGTAPGGSGQFNGTVFGGDY